MSEDIPVKGSVVVGVDGSDGADQALAWAAEQAHLEGRPLVVVHAVPRLDTSYEAYFRTAGMDPGEVLSMMRAEARTMANLAAGHAARHSADLEVHPLLVEDDARTVLIGLSEQAHLVVLGSRGLGPVRSLLLGSVGAALVRHAHTPVVVVRPHHRGQVRRGVLVGVDEAPGSAPVLEFAYRLASQRDLPLTVAHCFWDVRHREVIGVVPDEELGLDEERLRLAECLAGMGESFPDVRVTSRLVRGVVDENLLVLGDQMDVVVIGHHAATTSPVGASKALGIVEHATCPVAVVPVR